MPEVERLPDGLPSRHLSMTGGWRVHEGPGGMVSPVFVGREPELVRLRAALAQADIGAAQTIVIDGEAGVGKSRLVDEVASEAEEAGHLVLSGRCVQVGVDGLPFAPLVEALRALVRGRGRTRVDEV